MAARVTLLTIWLYTKFRREGLRAREGWALQPLRARTRKGCNRANFLGATPPPATIPSSTAAPVAWVASSTRSFFSFTATSVAPADADYRDAAGEFREPLLQLLATATWPDP
jgi:hypothetical protein